jgi:hypothetical protein
MSLWRALSRTALAVAWLLVLGGVAHPADVAPADNPEDVVKAYLAAMQKNDFKSAFPFLTADMHGNLDEEKWIAEQTVVMKLGEVSIDSYQVFPAKMEGNDKAIVPNLLKSKDKYINKAGKNEYELYTLVREPDHKWRIAQQAEVETDAVHKWFPADVPVE